MDVGQHFEEKRCFYCGSRSNSIDHVVPRSVLIQISALDVGSMRDFLKGRTLEVPSCNECNSLLGASYQKTLEQRKLELKRKLRQRYSKYLNLPEWTPTEIEELGPNLRSVVEKAIKIKILITERIKW